MSLSRKIIQINIDVAFFNMEGVGKGKRYGYKILVIRIEGTKYEIGS